MSKPIRWGILATGGIAGTFVNGLRALPDAEVVAVGSRSRESAEAFGAKFSIPRRHATYEALAADPEVDVVYVASLHPWHKENSILCLNHGKAVLCEKPFTVNAADAEAVIAVARRRKLFLMEAMWTRFLPMTVKVRQWIKDGVIGAPRFFQANFGFDVGEKPDGRHLKHASGGGALLDVGVYTIAYAQMVFGCAPESVSGAALIGPTGVDEQAGALLRFPGGRIAQLSFAVRTNLGQAGTIYGTLGRIRLEPTFWRGSKMVLSVAGKPDEAVDLPPPGNGYTCEAAEVMRCLREGRLESDVMPLAETVSILRTMDALRKPWGLRYPGEG